MPGVGQIKNDQKKMESERNAKAKWIPFQQNGTDAKRINKFQTEPKVKIGNNNVCFE